MIKNNLCLIAFALLALVGCGDKKTESRQEIEAKQTELFKQYLLTAAKMELKDPDSAQVRNVVHYGATLFFKKGGSVKLGTHTICGEINAKNSFGGYVGYRLFFATLIWDDDKNQLNGDVSTFIDREGPSFTHDLFKKQYSYYCKEKEETR